MIYNHTQIGQLMIYVLIGVVLLFVGIYLAAPVESAILWLYLAILLVLISFTALNVMIDKQYLRIKFTWGIFRKKFQLRDIASAAAVKNKWYYGWGIKYWRWPSMWIYNVSGFDAVQLNMKNGKIFRIGTDQPEILERAIKQAIK